MGPRARRGKPRANLHSTEVNYEADSNTCLTRFGLARGRRASVGDCGTAPSFTMAHGSIMTDGRCVTAGWRSSGRGVREPDGAVAVVVVNEAGGGQFELEVDGDLVLVDRAASINTFVVRRSTGAVAAAGAARTAAAAIGFGGGGGGGWGEWGGEGGGGDGGAAGAGTAN